jgi:hypothetical protein
MLRSIRPLPSKPMPWVKATTERCLLEGTLKGGSITVPLSSCLTGLDWSVLQIKTTIVSFHTADSKPVKQEVNGTVTLPRLVFRADWVLVSATGHWKGSTIRHCNNTCNNLTYNDNTCNTKYRLH